MCIFIVKWFFTVQMKTPSGLHVSITKVLPIVLDGVQQVRPSQNQHISTHSRTPHVHTHIVQCFQWFFQHKSHCFVNYSVLTTARQYPISRSRPFVSPSYEYILRKKMHDAKNKFMISKFFCSLSLPLKVAISNVDHNKKNFNLMIMIKMRTQFSKKNYSLTTFNLGRAADMNVINRCQLNHILFFFFVYYTDLLK